MNNHICRAKDIYTGEWVYGYYVVVPEEYGHNELVHAIFDPNECEHIGGGEYKDYGWYEVDPDTLCSCTTKKDKYGNSIFENDICKVDIPYGPFDENGGYEFKTCIALCEFYQFSAGFILVGSYGDIYKWYGTGMYSDIKDELVEVIGNKFDNPELMED